VSVNTGCLINSNTD